MFERGDLIAVRIGRDDGAMTFKHCLFTVTANIHQKTLV